MENVVTTNAGNEVVYKEFEDGVKYAIYVPKNVNENTPIFTYVYGSGGKPDWYSKMGSYGPYDSVIANESNSIIIMPDMSWSSNWGEKTMNIVNHVQEQYNITNNNVSASGFSMGGFAGYVTVAENLKRTGPTNLSPQIVYYIDDYSNKTYYNHKATLKEEEIDLFKENGTIFFAYEGASKRSGSEATNNYAKAGLNVIRVECEDGGHMPIKNNFFKNQVYEYMAGGTLPKEGYKYQRYVYDETTDKWKWVDIDYESVSTLENLYDYLGLEGINTPNRRERLINLEDLVLTSENKILENSLNGIRHSIKSTKMLLVAPFQPLESTTLMPSHVSNIISTYMTVTTNLLSKLANETKQFAKIGDSVEEMDMKLEKQVEELDEILEIEEIDTKNNVSVKLPVTTLPIVTETKENKTELSTNKEDTTQEVKTQPTTTTKEQKNTNTKPTYSNSYPKQSSSDSTPKTEPKAIEPAEALQEFPEYDKVVSDDNKLVFQNDKGYKLIIHKENNIINGVEHYYDFATSEDALDAIETIMSSYKGNEYLSQIVQQGQYIKIIFKTDIYKNYDINTLSNLYEQISGYNRI